MSMITSFNSKAELKLCPGLNLNSDKSKISFSPSLINSSPKPISEEAVIIPLLSTPLILTLPKVIYSPSPCHCTLEPTVATATNIPLLKLEPPQTICSVFPPKSTLQTCKRSALGCLVNSFILPTTMPLNLSS